MNPGALSPVEPIPQPPTTTQIRTEIRVTTDATHRHDQKHKPTVIPKSRHPHEYVGLRRLRRIISILENL
jgi:hypothetical protein